MKLSPLHSRVMSLFDSIQDKNHVCGMDNLYTLDTFCRKAYTHDRRVMVHGVASKDIQGIPDVVKQEEVRNQKNK